MGVARRISSVVVPFDLVSCEKKPGNSLASWLQLTSDMSTGQWFALSKSQRLLWLCEPKLFSTHLEDWTQDTVQCVKPSCLDA